MSMDPLGMLAFLTPSAQEIAVIVFLAFLLFGANKIPQLMRSLGRAQGEFQKAKREFEKEVKPDDKGAAKAVPYGSAAQLDAARMEAEDLGLSTGGKDLETLQREIADAKQKRGA